RAVFGFRPSWGSRPEVSGSERSGNTGPSSSALALAARVRAGEVSAREVVTRHLQAIVHLDEELHAFLAVMGDEAGAAAHTVDERIAAGDDPGPLAGIPVAVKDNICTLGVPTTCSSRILENWRPPYDATVIQRLAGAGGIVVGKTNLDEFAMGSSTENSAFGPTHNPHDPSRVPGGSSGGSAAAVAAGLVPVALGSDTGGSIRQPAALCGVVGMKPTYGTVSRYGLVAFASSLDQIGPFARNVADAAALFDVIGGHDHMDSTSLDRPPPRTLSVIDDGVNGCRVCVVRELVEGADPAVAAAVTAAADALADAGALVEECSVPEVRHALPAYYLLAPAEASSNLARYDGVRYGLRVDAADAESMNAATRAAGFGPEVKRRVMLGTYALSAGYYDAYYGQAQKVRTLIIEAFSRVYESADFLLGATTPTTAFAIGDKVHDPWAMYLSDVFSVPSNLSGDPAISVPFGADDAGLPIGVQILAPALGEAVLLRAASVLESAAPSPRTPTVADSALLRGWSELG
ncbi:MAG TPA: Asp-tRNA(Asn)/Glu-tRNA(Gln) amidotransferase subunit GatA, partial [Acidimicrobiales bacterium]|nr:Asp-tRNA(Asn)/Glu-tRNA(Gln) amidotransferase subunit GatA [Acidimicrobiales bacterium]